MNELDVNIIALNNYLDREAEAYYEYEEEEKENQENFEYIFEELAKDFKKKFSWFMDDLLDVSYDENHTLGKRTFDNDKKINGKSYRGYTIFDLLVENRQLLFDDKENISNLYDLIENLDVEKAEKIFIEDEEIINNL